MKTLALAFTMLVTFTTSMHGPTQRPVAFDLGLKAFRDGDVVEIKEVRSTSPRLEQGDTVTVKGRVRVESADGARLCLYLTQTKGDGLEETDATQEILVQRGLHDFKLAMTIKHQGKLHLTLYDRESGKPFGGVYFGTPSQMDEISDWDVSYYLKD